MAELTKPPEFDGKRRRLPLNNNWNFVVAREFHRALKPRTPKPRSPPSRDRNYEPNIAKV